MQARTLIRKLVKTTPILPATRAEIYVLAATNQPKIAHRPVGTKTDDCLSAEQSFLVIPGFLRAYTNAVPSEMPITTASPPATILLTLLDFTSKLCGLRFVGNASASDAFAKDLHLCVDRPSFQPDTKN